MIAYIDSSVLLRLALKQPNPVRDFRSITFGVSSRLLRAECLRTLDRLFSIEQISDEEQTQATVFILKAINHLELIPIDAVLENIENPLGLNLGTLDAIHLFSALKWKEFKKKVPVFLTHDSALGLAARRFGFNVLGI